MTMLPTGYFLGICGPCERPVRARAMVGTANAATVVCPSCGGPVAAQRLHAATTGQSCTSRCLSATSTNCYCSCGGASHGRTWAAGHGDELTRHLAAWRAETVTTINAKAQARRTAFTAWASHPDRAPIVTFLLSEDRPANAFLDELAARCQQGKALTPGQLAAAARWLQPPGPRHTEPVPAGDAVTVTGRIAIALCLTCIHEAPVYRMRVDADGWCVWSAIPAELVAAAYADGGTISDLQGRSVRFTAEVHAEPGKPSQGRADNPRHAVLLQPERITTGASRGITGLLPPGPTQENACPQRLGRTGKVL